MKRKLAIFDLDGTLFDTCHANFIAYKNATKKAGFQFLLNEEEFRKKYFGKSYKYFLPKIIPDINDELMGKIHKLKEYEYRELIGSSCRMNEHLFCIIDAITPQYNICIVTTASKVNVINLLTTFGVVDKFDLIVAREDVQYQKPNPEGYLVAMNWFSIKPENTIIFEDDSENLEQATSMGVTGYKVVCF